MANLSYNHIGISHLQACVPHNVIDNRKYTEYFSDEEAASITEKTGIEERRFADLDVCASDLAYKAAEKLIDQNHIQKEDIKFLIFVSQTPDYRMPATSIILQNKLGLSVDCMAFDMNIGCSGFVYGLSTMYGLLNSTDGENVKGLLLIGETRSRVYSPRDRKTAFLFGDAGAACLIDKSKLYGESFFELCSDGDKQNLIKIDSGGYRNPTNEESLNKEIIDEYGNIRTAEHGYMDGAEVFNFVIANIPRSLKLFLEGIRRSDDIRHYAFHQANRFMNNHLKKKLRIEDEKYIQNMDRFGNTSSVSIPLLLCTELFGEDRIKGLTVLCGFGVGMSWANGLVDLSHTKIGELIEC